VIVVVVVVLVVMVAVVFVIPVAFVHLPALLVVVVVGMGPIGTGIGRPLPDSGNPDVAAFALAPVAIDPRVAFSWHGGPHFIADRWRRGADINLNLAECRDCQGGRDSEAA
jgi:hypothetical protein